MKQHTLAFIGAGHIATSLIIGLINKGQDPSRIWATRRDPEKLAWLSTKLGVQITTDNAEAAKQAEVIILAVKPVDLPQATRSIAEVVQTKQPLVLSLAAGVRCEQIQTWLAAKTAASLVRCMPNTPAVVEAAATGLYATNNVKECERSLAESILRSVGLTIWVDKESDMDCITALSGSGPAYFLRIMEALQEAGKKLGLSQETARLLTLQTALGTAAMAMGSEEDLKALRNQVTSPGGTTAAGLEALEKQDINDLFFRVLEAARQRSCDLAYKQEKI